MQCGIPNHYPKFSKLHQFAYIIEPHHQEKGRFDQIKLGHQLHPNIYIYICIDAPTLFDHIYPFLGSEVQGYKQTSEVSRFLDNG